MPISSPLHAVTDAAGASFAEVAGYMMPTHYGDPAGEYRAATTAAAVFDVSHTGKVRLTGPDAARFVHNISTNDVKSLPDGGGCELFFCDSRAKALYIARAYRGKAADGRLCVWLDTTPGRGDALLKHLDKYLIAENVELEDITTEVAQMHLAGPAAKRILDVGVGSPVAEMHEFQHTDAKIGGVMVSVRRYDPLGVPGSDLVCPAADAAAVWKAVTKAGAVPAGRDAHEVLRVEAGTPEYGPDIDSTRFVMEVGRAARAVSYSKGCFPGQEPIVMARDRAGRVNRQFVGLRVLSGGLPAGGSKLTRDGQDVGVITSAALSPRLGKPLALGYVHWKSLDPRTQLDAAGGRVEVIGYPPFGG